jgi:acetolactate synthase-1/2/3 large subunit
VAAALSIRADARRALERLLAAETGVRKEERERWLAALARWRREMPLDDYPAGAGCHPAELLRRVDRLTRDEALVVVTGVGHHQQWTARHVRFDAPRRVLLTSGGHGAMGYDLPSAVGAAFARPGARVLCVVGDGSFQVNMQELGTIAEHRLPVKVLVIDNRRLAMVSQFQNLAFGRDPSTGDRPGFDFAGFARLYGIPAFELRGEEDPVEETLRRFLAAPGPALLHARVDPACDVSPMLLSGQALDAMWRWDA